MQHEAAIIAGAGPIGLACAISAKRRGIDPLVIDAGALANSIVRYPIGMTFFTTPERLEIGGHPLVCAGAKATREEALKYYRGVARAENIRVQTFTKLANAHQVETPLGRESITWDRLVLATGYFDHPNHLGVPGEELPHVRHYFDESHLSYGRDVVVIGGKNSAVEAALQLFRAGARTTIIYRGKEWPKSVKYWGRPAVDPETLQTSVPGLYVAGSVTAGFKISEIFIENGRFDGDKIFGTEAERERARALYQGIRRETGE